MELNDVAELINSQVAGAVLAQDENTTPCTLEIDKEKILEVCKLLHTHENCYFDQLSCLTGIDNGEKEGTMEVIYNLYSIPYNAHLMLKVVLKRESISISSVISVWKAANWHEREAYDMFGIHFENHPDLRRILLPEDWEGYPLRKDYVEPETYQGIRIKYEPKEHTKDV